MGRGCSQVVTLLTFYSDDPNSNPAKVNNSPVKDIAVKKSTGCPILQKTIWLLKIISKTLFTFPSSIFPLQILRKLEFKVKRDLKFKFIRNSFLTMRPIGLGPFDL